MIFHRSLWQNESGYGDDQTATCFRSRLFRLSVRVTPERVRKWESTMTGGNFSKPTPNHSVFPAPPHLPWRCVRIQRLSQYPNAASRSNNELAPLVLSPVIFTVSLSSGTDHSQLSLKKKKMQGGSCTMWNVPWHLFRSIKADDL